MELGVVKSTINEPQGQWFGSWLLLVAHCVYNLLVVLDHIECQMNKYNWTICKINELIIWVDGDLWRLKVTVTFDLWLLTSVQHSGQLDIWAKRCFWILGSHEKYIFEVLVQGTGVIWMFWYLFYSLNHFIYYEYMTLLLLTGLCVSLVCLF